MIHNLLTINYMEHTMLYAHPDIHTLHYPRLALQFTFYWLIMNAWIIVDFSLWQITIRAHSAAVHRYIS